MTLEHLPYVPATLQWPRPSVCWPPALGIVHDMEAPEGPLTAENCAQFFARPNATGSTHLCCDENSTVRCVPDERKSAGAKGAPYIGRTVNDWALQIEHAGYARQSRAEWLDRSSLATMEQGARAFAVWSDVYVIPPFRLTDAQIRSGLHGLCGHGDVTRALRVSGGHTDPGFGFPWDVYLEMIRSFKEAEVWTPEEKQTLLDGAKASIAMNDRWNKDARTKLEEVWTNLMDRDDPDPGFRNGTVGAMVQRILYPETEVVAGPQ